MAGAACRARGRCELSGWIKKKPTSTNPTGGCRGHFEWAHIKKRHHKEIRHDPENCLCLCKWCHLYFTDHEDEFYQAIENVYEGRHESLYEKMGQKSSFELREIYEKWIQFYKENR